MRVEIEVPVITWGRAKSTHSHKTVFASVPRVFEIPEYSTSEAPVVMAFSERYDGDKICRVEYFGIDGQLYTDRMAGADVEIATAFHLFRHDNAFLHPFFSAYAEEMGKRVDFIRRESHALAKQKMLPATFADQFENAQKTPYRFETMTSLGIRDFDEGKVQESVERFTKHMERFVIVGGNVMLREQEPIIEVRADLGSYSTELHSRIRTRPVPGPLIDVKSGWMRQVEFLSLRDHERLAERMAVLAARFSVKDPTQIKGAEILDVEIDDLRYANVSSEGATLMAAAELMKRAFIDNISNYSPSDDSDRVRAKTEAMLVALSPVDVDIMQRLIAGLAEADETVAPELLEGPVADVVHAYSSGRSDKCFGSRAYVEHAADALDRWHNREVGLNLSMAPAAAFRA
jgi:hypothetical protein|nr:hypothetical protein [Neorhizobium tomejilense]